VTRSFGSAAESFLRDAENEGRMTEAVAARRCVGLARLYQGDFIGAEAVSRAKPSSARLTASGSPRNTW
jgi:hypothetical protein